MAAACCAHPSSRSTADPAPVWMWVELFLRTCWTSRIKAPLVIVPVGAETRFNQELKRIRTRNLFFFVLSHLCSFHRRHDVVWFTFVQNFPVLLKPQRKPQRKTFKPWWDFEKNRSDFNRVFIGFFCRVFTFCLHKGSFLFSSALTSCWTTSLGVFTANTSFIVDPTTMILAPFVTLISRSVLSSGSKPLYMTFCMAGGRPAEETETALER